MMQRDNRSSQRILDEREKVKVLEKKDLKYGEKETAIKCF